MKEIKIRTDERLVDALNDIAKAQGVSLNRLVEDVLFEHAKEAAPQAGVNYLPEQIAPTRKKVEWKLAYRIWMAENENEAERIAKLFRVDRYDLKSIREGLNPASGAYEKEHGSVLNNWKHYLEWTAELNQSLGIKTR